MATNCVGRYFQLRNLKVSLVEAADQFASIDFVVYQPGCEPKFVDAKGSLRKYHRDYRGSGSESTWSMGLESLARHQKWAADVYYAFCHPEVNSNVYVCTAKSLVGAALGQIIGFDGKPAVIIPEHYVVPADEVFAPWLS